jgi:hypothetical protein
MRTEKNPGWLLVAKRDPKARRALRRVQAKPAKSAAELRITWVEEGDDLIASAVLKGTPDIVWRLIWSRLPDDYVTVGRQDQPDHLILRLKWKEA